MTLSYVFTSLFSTPPPLFAQHTLATYFPDCGTQIQGDQKRETGRERERDLHFQEPTQPMDTE